MKCCFPHRLRRGAGNLALLPAQEERRARLVLFLRLLDALRRKDFERSLEFTPQNFQPQAPADFERMIFQGNSVLTEHHVAEVGGVGVF